MIKIYLSPYHDVYKNVAIERYLFENSHEDTILFLWQNTPCVVFGRNQNVFNEVNIKYAKDNGIKLVRRFSGGGSVFQDEGNLNYTFILKDESLLEEVNNLIIKVFKRLNLDVYFSGRNDLLVDGKKFSGLAYCNDFDHVMYHGTCLVNSNLNELVNVLKPHDYKLKTHSVESYRSRVINLSEISKITTLDVINAFIDTCKNLGEYELIKDIKLTNDITSIITKLMDHDYIFNDCPTYSYPLEIRLNNSNYHFDIEYKDGIIVDVNIFSDDIDLDKGNYYKRILLHQKIDFRELENYLLNL